MERALYPAVYSYMQAEIIVNCEEVQGLSKRALDRACALVITGARY